MATAFYTVIGFFKMIVCYVLCAAQIVVPLVQKGSIEQQFESFEPEQKFTLQDDTVILQKDPAKDFVILNLTDLQLKDQDITRYDCKTVVEKTIKTLIEENHPDLITLTGDNAWGMLSYMWLADYLDSFKIPWAPVMGNHDGGCCPDEEWCAQILLNAKYSLYRLGPNDMGLGNYIISIMQGDRLIHTLYMMDTHENGIYENQVQWYEWAVKGAELETGYKTESTVFLHIPFEEYKLAWDEQVGEDKTESEFGYKLENICYAPDSGLFDKILELGSTKNIVAGHDHINSFMLTYQGIGLNYGLHTGMGGYWREFLSGGTVININENGVSLRHQTVSPADMGVWYDENMGDLD